MFDSIKRRLGGGGGWGGGGLHGAAENGDEKERVDSFLPPPSSIDYRGSRGWLEWSDFRRKYRPEGGIRFEMRKTYSTTAGGGGGRGSSLYLSLSLSLLANLLSRGVTLI